MLVMVSSHLQHVSFWTSQIQSNVDLLLNCGEYFISHFKKVKILWKNLEVMGLETVNVSITTLCFVHVITVSVRQSSCIFSATHYKPNAYGLSGDYFIS
jgi:hypothetical protein